MIDFNFENQNEIKRGSILISEPFLDDDYFSRAVIVLCEHNEEGSFGFVLNKYVDANLKDFIEEFPINKAKISIGGPVDTNNLYYIHSFGKEIQDTVQVTDELFIGGNFEQIKNKIGTDTKAIESIRFFIGYSGWEKGQLDNEIKEKSWIVLNNITLDQILNTDNENIWTEIMTSLGGKFKLMAQFPINPANN